MTSGHERASVFLEGAERRRRDITSPEGVSLRIELADYGERATAFVLDLFIWFCATVVIYLSLFMLLSLLSSWVEIGGASFTVALGVALFVGFLVRNLYFIHFELAWQGATPGKRIVGLRVIDRRGGPLLPTAVIARNLTREIETFLPMGLLMAPVGVGQGAAAWERLSLLAWLLLFAALPFFNRDRMRAGDLIAGTMVIALPRRMLLGDLVEKAFQHAFTDKQLRAYGAFELQILEELLRRPDAPGSKGLRRDVCEKICRKIEWLAPVPDGDTDLFLKDFYTAERAFLEREQLFGKLHPDKHYETPKKE